MDELLRDFLAECDDQLDAIGAQLVRFEQDPTDARIVANLFRLFHAIKGACGFLELPRMESVAHAAESLIGAMRERGHADPGMASTILAAVARIKAILGGLAAGKAEPPGDDSDIMAILEFAASGRRGAAASDERTPCAWNASLTPGPTPPERRIDTVRVSVKTLEDLTAQVSELALVRNQLCEGGRAPAPDALAAPLRRLSAVTAQLQAVSLTSRMQPIARLFANFQRLANNLGADLGKRIELVLEGGEVEIDRQMLEAIRDPLTRLIQNAAGHGLETSAERRRVGKPETGVIGLSARRFGDDIVVDVADDGRGLDVAGIRERAFRLGYGSRGDLAGLSQDDLCRLVFKPGFSTAPRVTSISGRGVGLDLVRASVEAIGGVVTLKSVPGRGARVRLRIPLSLAVTPAIIVRAGADRFALARHAVEQVIELTGSHAANLQEIHGALTLRVAGELLPAAWLERIVASAPSATTATAPPLAVRLRSADRRFALVVDAIEAAQEILIEPLPAALRRLEAFSGAAILGDGSIALALDPAGLASALGLPKSASAHVAPARPDPRSAAKWKAVVFRAGRIRRALPLAALARIEPIRPDDLVRTDSGWILHSAGGLVALAPIDSPSDRRAAPRAPLAVILQDGANRVGVLADEIVDIVEGDFAIEISGARPHVLGVATILGQATEVLDAFRLLDQRRGAGGATPTDAASGRLLVVEESSVLRACLNRTMTGGGWRPTFVGDAREALAEIGRGDRYDALLADLATLAVGDATLAQRFRDASQGGRVIALADHSGGAAKRRARAAGFETAIGRFDRQGLLAALASARHEAEAAA